MYLKIKLNLHVLLIYRYKMNIIKIKKTSMYKNITILNVKVPRLLLK